jgi:hypothetical protein
MSNLAKRVRLFIALILLWVPTHIAYGEQTIPTSDAPVELSAIENFEQVGTAQMKWLWLKIYQATLLTPSGTYQANQWPIALELLYQQNITAQQLIKSTEKDWKRQNIDYSAKWITALEKMWPDISTQDQLTLYVDADSTSHFFYNGQFIGSILDPLFSVAFTAIWLSNNTIKPAQRNQLIGINP